MIFFIIEFIPVTDGRELSAKMPHAFVVAQRSENEKYKNLLK